MNPLLSFLCFILVYVWQQGALAQTSPAIKTVDLHCWPLSLPEPVTIGRITFDAKSTQSAISGYRLPPILAESANARDEMVRLGFFLNSRWVGSLTTLSALLSTSSGESANGDGGSHGGRGTLFKVQFDPISKQPYQISLESRPQSEPTRGQRVSNPHSQSAPDAQLIMVRQGVAPTYNDPGIHNYRGQLMEAPPPETMISM